MNQFPRSKSLQENPSQIMKSFATLHCTATQKVLHPPLPFHGKLYTAHISQQDSVKVNHDWLHSLTMWVQFEVLIFFSIS